MNNHHCKVSSYIEDRWLSYLLMPVKIKITKNLPKIQTLTFSLRESSEGDLLEVPRWVAEDLYRLGFAEIQEESFEIEIFKALSRERMQASLQLSTLNDDFYLKMKKSLERIKKLSTQESMTRNDLEKISTLCYDLVSLRTGKILHLASTASLSSDLENRLTSEEKKLFNLVHTLAEEWKGAILRED